MECFIVLSSSTWLTEIEIVKIIWCNHLLQLVFSCFCMEQRQLLIVFYKTFLSESFPTQPAITCSKLTIETLEQGVKYVQC